MTLDQRSITILNKVVHAPSHVSAPELMEELKVSRRTIYYDVEKINDWLGSHGLAPMEHIRSAGFFLSDEVKVRIHEQLQELNRHKHYHFSPQERMAWTAIFILTRETKITLRHLIDKMNVSRSTLLEDIRQLKRQLVRFKVDLQFHRSSGYYIAGEEQNKRKILVYYLSEVLNTRSTDELLAEMQMILHDHDGAERQLDKVEMASIYRILDQSETAIGVRYTDEVIQTLSIHLLLLIKRFVQGKHIFMDPVEKEVIRETREYRAARFIGEQIESDYCISLPDDEIFYIATYLLGSKVSAYEPTDGEHADTIQLKSIIIRMVDDFQKYACVVFENRRELERNLFIHLKPAYFRIKYGIQLANPLTETVKNKYGDLLILTKKVVHHFEHVLNKPISNDEIAYNAMHFGGWIDKEGVRVEARQKAAVVCASGIGTSRILQKQIEDLLPSVDVAKILTVREYEKASLQGIDFVISTTPIDEKNLPLYIVNPILNHAEKTSLLKQIQSVSEPSFPDQAETLMSVIKKHADIRNKQALLKEIRSFLQMKKEAEGEEKFKPMLNELLTEDRIQFLQKAESWEEAIKIASEPLLADGSITEEYVDAMIKNVHEVGPYIVIAPSIALPHARPEQGVNKVGMSFLQLKQSCSITEKEEHQFSLVFVLAAIDNETHLKALSQLSTMLSDRDNIETLRSAERPSDVLAIINQYSK